MTHIVHDLQGFRNAKRATQIVYEIFYIGSQSGGGHAGHAFFGRIFNNACYEIRSQHIVSFYKHGRAKLLEIVLIKVILFIHQKDLGDCLALSVPYFRGAFSKTTILIAAAHNNKLFAFERQNVLGLRSFSDTSITGILFCGEFFVLGFLIFQRVTSIMRILFFCLTEASGLYFFDQKSEIRIS